MAAEPTAITNQHEIEHMRRVFADQRQAFSDAPMPDARARRAHLKRLKEVLVANKDRFVAAPIPDLTLVEENHLIQNLLKLQSGSVDVVIGDRRSIIMQLNEYMKDRISDFAVVDMPLPDVQRHVAASRDLQGHEQLIEQFNRALAETRKDGSLEAIINKWDERQGKFD